MNDKLPKNSSWGRIQPASGTVLAPKISSIRFRRSVSDTLEGDICSDLCENQAEFVIREVPVTLMTSDGRKINLPDEIDTPNVEKAVADLDLTKEQIRYLVNERKRLSLCLNCLRERERVDQETESDT